MGTDDLPVIKESIRKGFFETQSKVNSWVANFRKRIDGEDDEEIQNRPARPATGHVHGFPTQPYGARRSGEFGRRSGDREQYDADPQVLSDDFTSLQLKDEEGTIALFKHDPFKANTSLTVPPRRPTRPLANPDLFKPTPATPPAVRRVSFQEGPPEEIDDLYRASPDSTKRTPSSGGSRQSKWQPLSAVDPNPVGDHDPFSLGDSDDEDNKKKDVRAEDTARLKAAAEAVAEEKGFGVEGSGELRPAERSEGARVRDKEAEERLGGK